VNHLKKCLLLAGLLGLVALSCAVAQEISPVNDKDINVLDYKDLEYPAIAVTSHTEGVVVIRVTLDHNGRVSDAVVISGASLLTPQSLENAKNWRFQPNHENAAVIVYDFRIRGACHAGSVGSQMVFYPPNHAQITACPQPPCCTAAPHP